MSPRYIPNEMCYRDLPVVTTKQIAALYCCTRQNIDNLFRKYKDKFVEGEDYFKITGDELKEFKSQYTEQPELTGSEQAELSADEYAPAKVKPFSNSASSLYIWTKTGAFKFSEYVGTDRAKTIYAALSMSYFRPNQSAKPKQLRLFEPKNNISADKIEMYCNFLDKLIALCSMTDDKNLREKLIKRAAELI